MNFSFRSGYRNFFGEIPRDLAGDAILKCSVVVNLPGFPWEIQTKPNSAMVEMWDDRKWMFPSPGGTGGNWEPGK